MGKSFAAGGDEANRAFAAILVAMAAIEDPQERTNIGLALFKTRWEEANDAIKAMDLKKAGQQFDDIKGNELDAPTTPVQFDPNHPGALVAPPGGNVNAVGDGLGLGLGNLVNPTPGAPVPANSPLAPPPPPAPGINPSGPGMAFDDAKKQIEAADKGDKTKPTIDPKLWSVEANPVAMPPGLATVPTGIPGALAASPKGGPGLGRYEVDPMRVYDAESSAIRAKNSLEQDRIALIRLEQQGNADQDALLRARNQVADAERSYVSSQMKLAEAQQGTWKKLEGSTKGLVDGMDQIGAALDKDFGFSKGLPGLAENLTKFLANLGAAPMLGQLNAISAANPSKGGYGAMGVLAARGAFGPQYTGLPDAAGSAGAGYPGYPARGGYAPYPGDAALLANIPAGRYEKPEDPAVWDLTRGLGDCSSAVEDLVNIMDGRPTAGREMSTGNAAQWLTQHGFQPGVGQPGDFQVGDSAAAQRGMDGGQGANDPALTSRYYRPATGGYSPVAPTLGVAPTPITPSAPGYAPLTDSALSDPGLTNPALTVGIPAAGGGWGGATGPAQAWSPSSTRIGGVEPATGSGAGGVGITPGGTIDTAIGMAASAADIFAPGAGQAAQTGVKLASRAIQFGGQAAGIGVMGAMDALLPTGGSELANKSWLTKALGGLAGAAPAIPNVAGKATAPPNPNQSDPNAQGGPVKAGDTNIHVTNNRATEDGTGRDIAFHQQARNSGPGM
ncbi:phage tail tape measure protein [Aduncisulcus paluster]|uniref:Phage tail tape measure protein n=1 Tax=Aduncisulcus paluster TaxID=2918883 RepID=A0ABQ5KDH1_9EUKA|nr:phage tail tape measure protein [Aduncisulcus paluster]